MSGVDRKKMAENPLKYNPDRFSCLRDISQALVDVGFGKCGLIFGIDYTMSNKVQGEKTFGGYSLHEISDDRLNPYQEVITIIGQTLEPLDDDGKIPAFGFGDIHTKGDKIFALKRGGPYCKGFKEVLEVYNQITPHVTLHRPTNFAPLIYEAIEIVKRTKKYHILVIVADGQVNSEEETTNAIVAASRVPLSIVVCGVGDGPWGMMTDYDDRLPPNRDFDNFQFLNFHEVTSRATNPRIAFALHALMEIPDQCKAIKQLNLLEKLGQHIV